MDGTSVVGTTVFVLLRGTLIWAFSSNGNNIKIFHPKGCRIRAGLRQPRQAIGIGAHSGHFHFLITLTGRVFC